MATASHHGQNSLPAPGQLPSSMQNQIQSQMQGHQHPLLAKLTLANENSWLQIAALAETLGDSDKALNAAEAALRHNAYSLAALKMAGSLCRAKEMYPTVGLSCLVLFCLIVLLFCVYYHSMAGKLMTG